MIAMKILPIIFTLFTVLLISAPPPVFADVFKVETMKGEWREISDTYIVSERSIGESVLRLYADGYRMGSWVISIDMDLDVEEGGEIYGYIKVEVPELGISLLYTERYINRGLIGMDYIENNLTLSLNGETLIEEYDYAEEPMNSRLNTRFYFVLMKVVDRLILEFRDEYNNPNSLKSIYAYRELDYNDEPVTFIIEVYKNSFEKMGSVKAPLIINVPKDSISMETFQYQTLDYSANAIFFLSLSFLLGAISFNLISTKFRMLKEELVKKESKKQQKKRKK